MNWTKELNKWHTLALEMRIKQPCSLGKTPFMLRIYPYPSDNCVVWECKDGLGPADRKRLMMVGRISLPQLQPVAVLMQSDTWQVRSDRFSEHYGIAPNLPYDKFQEEYFKILNRDLGGSLGNAPSDVRGEVILTTIKGPKLPEQTLMGWYRADEQDRFQPEPPAITGDGHYYQNNLIPDWWPVTKQ